MPRKPSFTSASLYIHFQSSMARAFPAADGLTAAMQEMIDRLARPVDLSLSGRLSGLKRLFDAEAEHRESAAAV